MGAGNYNVTYTYVDGNGCIDSAAQIVVVDICNSAATGSTVSGFSVTPNPNSGEFMLTFNATSADDYVLEIYNSIGEVVYVESLNNFSGVYTGKIDLTEFARGIYTVRLRSSHDEHVQRVITN